MSEGAQDHEARALVRELDQKLQSFVRLWDANFDAFKTHFTQRMDSGLLLINTNKTEMNSTLVAMEGRLNIKISESEGRTVMAINELKGSLSSIQGTYSARFWDIFMRVTLGAFASCGVLLMAYLALIKH